MNNQTYKPLEDKFESIGFTFEKIKDLDSEWKIFKRTANKTKTIHYELVRPTEQKEFMIHGNLVEAKIRYPSTSEFGRNGFCCCSIERCEYIYQTWVLPRRHEQEEREEKKEIKVVFPSKKPFLIKDLEKLNPDLSYAQIYNKVKDLLILKKIKISGEKENTKGKNSHIYILI